MNTEHSAMQEDSRPLINCHTHIFTADHVPPYLAKAFVPWPLYYLIPVSLIVRLFRSWYNGPYTWQFKPWYHNIQDKFYNIKILGKRHRIIGVLNFIVWAFLTAHALFIIFNAFLSLQNPTDTSASNLLKAERWLTEHDLLIIPASIGMKILLVLLVVVFYKISRNIIYSILKKIWSFLDVLPGPQTKELIRRYINIGRFAFYKHQARIYGRLQNQYPEGSGFIVLPMDMEYMEAGKLKAGYHYPQQMSELAALKQHERYKDTLFPFVFADPRRMSAEGSAHFSYSFNDAGQVNLQDCFIKQYIEQFKFSGFKIYPALGYYPFDEALLPLWKYAADHGLPIITHCIKGTIFYRGDKKKAWDHHPLFEQACGNDRYEPLSLMEIDNKDFINNFTHPLNYLCLLKEELLRKLVGRAGKKIQQLFGYTEASQPLLHDLSHLKLCFGHFGGDDEWNRYMELDRDNHAAQLAKRPDRGIDFLLRNADGEASKGKLEQIWKHTDWYSIICSMMLQHPNVYADLSYIIHSRDIQPLLNQTLQNPGLRERVLFGTDFYVVRNHKSERNMLADISSCLDRNHFDQIARKNPRVFLSNTLHGPVTI